MANKNGELAAAILPLVGGKDNIITATHCMTRLRLQLKDYEAADKEALKALKGVSTALEQGGQLQIVIGTTVGEVYEEFVRLAGVEAKEAIDENLDDKTKSSVADRVFGYLSGTMVNIIPIMIAASLCKTVVAVFGPQLLNVMPEGSDLLTLFTFLGDAGFYFLPIFIANFAAQRLGVSSVIAMLLAAAMQHPTMIQMALDASNAAMGAGDPVTFAPLGIAMTLENYSAQVLPILLVVWIMSYVEKFLKKICPDVLKVVVIPFGTYIIMAPIALYILGPLGAVVGNYICQGIIALYNIAGPFAVAIVGATFSLLVMTGMHQLLFVYLFTTFPMLGFDGFLLPGILACSWAGTGVALGYVLRCKDKEYRSTIIGFIITWFLGGVGEPMLYGLNAVHRKCFIGGIVSGALAGFVAGILGLKAYVLNPSNGIYGLAAFLGGPTSNYFALAVTIIASLALGIATMFVLPDSLDGNTK